MKRLGALALLAAICAACCTSPVFAEDQVWMNRAFRFGSYDFRIIRIEWTAANGYLVPLGQPDPDGTGALVLTIALRNAGKYADHLPTPDIAVILRDGTQTSLETRFAHDFTGKRLGLDVYAPGEGPTVQYVVASVPKPSASNPVSKIVFSPRYSGGAGPGIRPLYNPPVVIAP
ncbi:MAG: hypothetical protein M3126_06600 [Candidatus Eremiobacteraeota bacterium]|nr:hypothetical protein [Candidatus Eremiobacteraeota bacterium]